MPKGARGSRGKSKGRPNPVRVKVQALRAPRNLSRAAFGQVLRESIAHPQYELPDGYEVAILWSNDGGKTWRSDEWTNALIDSATYGRGWDNLVLRYLDMVGI